MRVYICGTCQTQHDYGNITATTLCDECKQPIDSWQQFTCEMCNADNQDEDPEYHRTCLIVIAKERYCKAHAVTKQKRIEAAAIIEKYAKKFWGELGGKIIRFDKLEDGTREFKVSFAGLELKVNMTVAGKGGVELDDAINEAEEEITALIYTVSGIKKRGKKATYTARIHSHNDALVAVGSAIIRSIRSKKSVMSSEKSLIWEDATRSEKREFNLKYKEMSNAANTIKTKIASVKEEMRKKSKEVAVEV